MDVRVERALGLDLGEAVPLDEAEQRAVDEPDALLQLRLLVLGGGLERPLEVVEHGQELVQEPLVRAAGQLDLLARDALAVVVEVGGEAEIGLVRSRGGSSAAGSSTISSCSSSSIRRLEGLVGHDVFASSSSITS